MSKRRSPKDKVRKGQSGPQKGPQPKPPQGPRLFAAGCGREWKVTTNAPDLAYTEQAFPECPSCQHRVEPEGGPPFCTLRPAANAHPFASLAELLSSGLT